MNKENAIVEMLRLLKQNNIYAMQEFKKDLLKLVNTDIDKLSDQGGM